LDTCQFETVIKARVPQLQYSDGTVEELTVPWAERYSRVTTMMAGFAIKLLEACPTTQAVCTQTRLSWSTVNASHHAAPQRAVYATQNDCNLGICVTAMRLLLSPLRGGSGPPS
jgi:transposase